MSFMTSRTLLVAAAVLFTTTFAVTVRAQHVHETAQLSPKTVAPMKAHTGPIPPLPQVSFTPTRPLPIVQQVYEFAARHPEVLQYVPCYCGCERVGHNGNHDCFVKSRAANGRVTEWDTHGMGCAICLDVGRDAMTLFNSGNSPTQIRAAIDKKYGSHFPSSTPTPKPRSSARS
jgi:Protein of unknown function with PCYCGC motif